MAAISTSAEVFGFLIGGGAVILPKPFELQDVVAVMVVEPPNVGKMFVEFVLKPPLALYDDSKVELFADCTVAGVVEMLKLMAEACGEG